jgi:hypothetical protein
MSAEILARAQEIFARYDRWRSTTISRDGMDEYKIMDLELYDIRFERYMRILRSVYDIYVDVPKEYYYKTVLERICDEEPKNPIEMPVITVQEETVPVRPPYQTPYGMAYHTLQEAINVYKESFAIVEINNTYISCKDAKSIEDLACSQMTTTYDLVDMNEIVLPESIQKLSFIINSSDRERMEQIIKFIIHFFKGMVTRDDIAFEPREGTSFVVIRPITATYYEHQKTFDRFIDERSDKFSDIMSMFKMPELTIDPVIGPYMKIRRMKYMIKNKKLVDAPVESLRASNTPITFNCVIVNGNVAGSVNGNVNGNSHNEIAVSEEKLTDRAFAKQWVKSNPPNSKRTTKRYYEKYRNDTEESDTNDPVTKQDFDYIVKNLGYVSTKDRTKQGKYFWEKTTSEDLDISEDE